MTTLWDTTGTAVVKALAAERRAHGSVSSGLALTLVVVVQENLVQQAERAATRAAAEHPCRMLIVVRRRPDAPEARLDAEVLIGGRLGRARPRCCGCTAGWRCTPSRSCCRCSPPTPRW
jgi:hypothetical protein